MTSAIVVGGTVADHDHDAAAPDRTTRHDRALSSTVLSAALGRLRLEGAVFLRAEYREPWAYESLTGPETAKVLRPDAERVILFHVVANGTCWPMPWVTKTATLVLRGAGLGVPGLRT